MEEGRRQRCRSHGMSEKQDRFVRLIALGVSNSEACRRVGINRRTGTRWRFGRMILNTAGDAVHYPPVLSSSRRGPRHPRFLSVDERTVIADLQRAGSTVRVIAAEIGRSASTVSRELRRNAQPSGRYLPAAADRLATDRLHRPRQRRVRATPSWVMPWSSCWPGDGAPSRSLTNLPTDSRTSRADSCAWSRSIRRSTTLTLPCHVLRSVADAVGAAGSKVWNVAVGSAR